MTRLVSAELYDAHSVLVIFLSDDEVDDDDQNQDHDGDRYSNIHAGIWNESDEWVNVFLGILLYAIPCHLGKKRYTRGFLFSFVISVFYRRGGRVS